MHRIHRVIVFVLLAVTAHTLTACAGEQLHWNSSPILDFKSVAGNWEGLMIQAPQPRSENGVRVHIREDGTFQFFSYRTIGVFSGNGSLTLDNGTLTAQTDRGRMTLSLYMANDQRMLKGEGVSDDGLKYSAELTPAKGNSRGEH